MNTTTRTLTGLALASAAVTVALAAPANAQVMPDPVAHPASGRAVDSQQPGNFTNARVAEYQATHELGASTTPPPPTSTLITNDSGVDWAQVAYGAAAGIALTTAAGATMILVRRRQNLG